MPFEAYLKSPRRSAVTVQKIQSPLTLVGYSLQGDATHLFVLLAGHVRIRRKSDGTELEAEGTRVIWLGNGADQELLAEGGTRGVLVSISQAAMLRALPATAVGDQMRRTFQADLVIYGIDVQAITTLLDGLHSEYSSREPGADIARDCLLALALVQLWRQASATSSLKDHSPHGLAERFVQLSSQHLREHWRVQDYARAMEITRERLGSAVQRATGMSPQNYLHRELMREARDLLQNSTIPISQIAFRLGFQDAAYFSRFFKREYGKNPSDFRKLTKNRDSQKDGSYAAWP